MVARTTIRGIWGAVAALATTGAPDLGAQPAAQPELDPVALHWAARAAIRRGVDFLRRQSAEDPGGWVTPPRRHARVVGTTNVVVRYSARKAPLYEYETYTVYERRPGDTSQSARTLQPVQRRRVKGIKDPEGRTVLVRDRNGPIEKIEPRPLYEAGGIEQWMYGRLGQNAMALFALRHCGVSEEDEPVQRLRQNLVEFVEGYGLPDGTWDLAWIAAGFARLGDDDARRLTAEAASKLLDGQIVEGDARGLWGPVCIHVPLLASAYLHEQELARQMEKAKLALKERPDSASRERELDQAERALHAFQAAMRRIAMLAMAFANIDAPAVRLGDDTVPPVQVPGAVHYVFNQTTADLDSTSLALAALREVARAGRMPAETWRPPLEGIRGAPPPEKSEAVVARAVHALARVQLPNGGWTETNLHQPVTSFDKLARMIPGVPVDARSFSPLPSPETPLSCLQGYSALCAAAETAGFAKVMARFRGQLFSARDRAAAALAEVPSTTKTTFPSWQQTQYRAAGLALLPATRLQDRHDLWRKTTYGLLQRQQTNGAWQAASPELAIPSSLRARMQVLERRADKDRTKVLDRAKAHVRANWSAEHRKTLNSTDQTALATCYALLALAGQVRPPAVVARWGTDSAPRPHPLAETVLRGFQERLGVDWSYVAEAFPIAFERIETARLLFVEGQGRFVPDAASRAALAGVVRGGGLVVAHAPATAEGRAFLDTVAGVAEADWDGARGEDIAADASLLGDYAGKLGRILRGIRLADGGLAAVLLPLAESGGPSDQAFSTAQGARLVERLAQAGPEGGPLSGDYALSIDALGTPDSVYTEAMAYLRGMARRDSGAVTANGEVSGNAAATQPEASSPPAADAPATDPQERPPAEDELL